MQFVKGDKVRVKATAPFHAGREAYFDFYAKGQSKGTAVLTTEKSEAVEGWTHRTLFAVANEDVEAVS